MPNELDYVEVNCINSWIIDDKMRTYDDMNLYPPPLICPKNIFNLWTPFYADQLPKSTIEENEDVPFPAPSSLIKVMQYVFKAGNLNNCPMNFFTNIVYHIHQ